jgi:hypothetical protein
VIAPFLSFDRSSFLSLFSQRRHSFQANLLRLYSCSSPTGAVREQRTLARAPRVA